MTTVHRDCSPGPRRRTPFSTIPQVVARSRSTCLARARRVVMTLLFLPFTITHGPTPFNEERTLLGLDMHFWGLLLGVARMFF